MKNPLLIFLLLVLLNTKSRAQQDPNYVLYRYVMNVMNPAYAGADGSTSFTFNLRNQLQGVDGAPSTQTFFGSTPITDRLGLGLSVVNDKTFIERQTSVFVDFSYKLQLNDEVNFFMGLKAGGNFFDLNANGLQTFNGQVDPLLQDQSRFNPNIGVGFLMQHERFFLSLSSPRLLNTERFDEQDGVVTEATDELHIFFSGGYNFQLSEKWFFKPSFIARYVNGAPISADITSVFEYNKIVEFGAAYRTDEAISGLVFFNISDWLSAGYAYDNSLRSELSGIAVTHEILMIFRIPQS